MWDKHQRAVLMRVNPQEFVPDLQDRTLINLD